MPNIMAETEAEFALSVCGAHCPGQSRSDPSDSPVRAPSICANAMLQRPLIPECEYASIDTHANRRQDPQFSTGQPRKPGALRAWTMATPPLPESNVDESRKENSPTVVIVLNTFSPNRRESTPHRAARSRTALPQTCRSADRQPAVRIDHRIHALPAALLPAPPIRYPGATLRCSCYADVLLP